MTDDQRPLVVRQDFEAARLRQLTAGLDVSPVRRLQWLEEAIAFAVAAGALPRPAVGNERTEGGRPISRA